MALHHLSASSDRPPCAYAAYEDVHLAAGLEPYLRTSRFSEHHNIMICDIVEDMSGVR